METDSESVIMNGHPQCGHCHSVVCHCNMDDMGGEHTAKVSNEALSEARHNLTAVLSDLEEENCRLRWLHERVDLFEMSYEECNSLIRKTAENLICKIRGHEQRLLEETETHRQTEYRKLGCTREVLDQNCSDIEVLQKQGHTVLNNSSVATEPCLFQLKAATTKINKALHDNDGVGDNENSMAKIYFCPVRCNTAFGTIDTTEPSGTPPRSWSGDSTSPRLSPLNVSPVNTLPPPLGQLSKQRRTRSLAKTPLTPSNALQLLESGLRSEGGKKQRRCSLQVQHSPTQSPKNPCPSIFASPLPENPSSLILAWEVNTEGMAPGQVNCPNDVTFLQDDVVAVSDRDNQRVQLFNSQGKFLKVIGQGKIKPRRLARTRQGHIALTDSKDNCVKVFDANGQVVSTWGKKRFKSIFKAPCGIAVNSRGQFIVSDMERHSVTIHQPDGKTIRYLGSNGQQVEFQSPSYVTVNHRDEILVADNCCHHVKVFDKEGNYLSQFSKFDSDDSHLKYPNGVCTDEGGDIFVADWGNHLVSQFDPCGAFCGHLLTRNDNLYHPAGIAVQNSCLILSEYSDTHSAVRFYSL